MDNDGYIRRFQEKPDPGTEFSNYINAGCVIIEKEILDNFSLERHSMERVVFPPIAESGQMAGLLFTGYFVDAGTPQSYIEAVQTCIDNDRFKSGKKINQSWFADDVEKMESVKRCSIGANVSIDPSASLTDCVVLNNAIIGKNTFLDSCLIGEGAIIKDGIVISEEVIGHRATR